MKVIGGKFLVSLTFKMSLFKIPLTPYCMDKPNTMSPAETWSYYDYPKQKDIVM